MKMELIISHSLQQIVALQRVQRLLNAVKKSYADKISNLEESWSANVGTFSFSTMGFHITGSLEVKKDTVAIKGNLPFAAYFLKGKIEQTILERAKELLK